ncbi:MAG TPA: FAD-dependent oxidoreductase [Trebonia sp.]|jgi:NADPH-dependent 2,4-dienoyl-CoA reductase/sulfur reductase-like enzyme/ferredoxin|nr:FAD-dependent oxidoreductase [Trebonia sp.]
MKLVVDLTRCQGYGQCAYFAPGVFQMRGNEVLMDNPEPDDDQRERVLRAAAACPVQAIRVDGIASQDSAPAPSLAAAVPAQRTAPGIIAAAIEDFRRSGRIVIVGASLAGMAAAAVMRRDGFTGSITIIGDEKYQPYDRPPLSKGVFEGLIPADHTELPGDVNAQWLLGVPATGLDYAGKQVRLGDGSAIIEFDRLLIATGTRARPWPNKAEAALDGVFVLRTRDDAAGLSQRLASRPRRVLVIGAGFTGSEVASACRDRDIEVTVVERGPAPLVGALGEFIGDVAAGLQRAHGVDLRCGVTVTSLEGDDRGRLRRAHLSDGSVVDADLAVVALGAIRNTEWLRGSGLAVGKWGLACDAGCRAFDVNGATTDNVFVAGDVARFPHPLYDYEFLALEHWGNAVTQAEIAAHNMVSAPGARWAHLATPVFWSAQFGTNIKSVGVPTFADEFMVVQGSVPDRRFVAAYGRNGRMTGAVAFDQAMWLEFYQHLIETAQPFPPEFTAFGQPAGQPVPVGMTDKEIRDLQATVVLTGHDPGERRAELLYHDH